MDHKLKRMAKTGYASKGAVYAITGILTFMAAFNLGGQKTGKLGVLEFLDEQAFGNILLILMGLGLASYAAWRFVQSIADPEDIGSDKKAMVKRIAYFISGCIYLGLAVLAVLRVFGSRSGNSGNSGTQSHFLSTDVGLIILGAVGVAIIGTGIYQIVKAYKEEFIKKFDLRSISEEKRRKTIENTGYFGLGSRGVVYLIIGAFALKAAINSNPSEIKSTADAFGFLQDSSYGAWLMGAVAAGLIGYAVFMFMMAKYRKFHD